jgi:hypothetical protein
LYGLTPASDYDLYIVAEDKAAVPNLQDSVTLLQFTTQPNMPPVFLAGYPFIDNIQDSRFDLYVSIDEPARWFYVVVPDGADAPSVSQVILGQQADNSPAFLSGDYDFNSYGGSSNYQIRGTEPLTSYDVYIVARDMQAVPNIQAFVTKLDLTTTADIYAPEYQVNPQTATVYDQQMQVLLQLNEAGKAYYVVDTAGSSTPTVNQVFAGTTSTDGTPVVSGAFDVAAGYLSVLGDVTGLDPETSYRIFIVVEDDEAVPNKITYVQYINFTTTRSPRDYFWVGNSGNWSEVSHWAGTSGGTDYWDTPPSQIDNVYFDENSFTLADQTVTVNQTAYFNDMVWINDTLQPGLSSGYTLYAYGSVIAPDSIRFNVNSLDLRAADSGNVLSIDFTNNNGDNLSYLYVEAYGEYTITDSVSIYRMEHYSGGMVFDSPVYIQNVYFYNTGSKSMTINTPGFRAESWVRYGNTNLTLDAAGTEFLINGYMHDEDGGTYPRVKFIGNVSTQGSFSVDTLILNPGITTYLQENSTITINELVAEGTKTSMIEIRSSTEGTQANIYKSSGTVNAEYLKIRDNAATGGATFNASNSLDQGNNSGWNFTPPASLDYYWTGSSGNWSELGHWSHTSGGPADHLDLPGQFDNVYFDGNSFTDYGQQATVDISPVNIHTLDMTGSRYDPTLYGYIDLNIYGSLILHDSVSFNIRYVYFRSDSAGNVIHDAGAGGYFPYYYFYGNGSWTLTDSLSVYRIYHENGSLDLNDQPVNVDYFYSRYSANRSLDLGNSMITVGSRWDVNGTNLTLVPGNSTIYADGATFYANQNGMPGIAYNDLVVNSYINLYNTTTFNNLTVLPGSTLVLEAGKQFTVNQLSAEGTEAQKIYIQSTPAGVQAELVKSTGTVTGYHLDITDNIAGGGAVFNAYFSDTTNSLGWNLLQASQTVTFDTTTYLLYDPDGFVMNAVASSGDDLTFELISGDGMVSNDTLYANVPDTFMVRAFQAGNEYYLPSDTAGHIYYVLKLNQAITFGSLADKEVDDPPFLVTATAGSGLPVSFSVAGPVTISNDTIYLTGETGIVEITASQAGDAYYKAAAPVLQTFNVNSATKTDQTISFDVIPDQTYGTAYIVLSATASSGLPVTFTLLSGPATLSADTVYIHATGTIEVRATQAGNGDYNPAPSVTRTFVVNKAPQTITFPDIPDLTYGDDPYPLGATAGSGLIVTYQVNSGNASVILSEPNVIQNGSFDEVYPADSTAVSWSGWGGPDNAPLPRIIDGVAVCTPVAADFVWEYQFSQAGLNALPNVDYILMFKAWADAPRTFSVDFEDSENNYRRYGSSTDPRFSVGQSGRSDWTFDVTTEPAWYMFHVNFDSIMGNTIQKVQFMLGTSGIVTYIDSVILVRNYELDLHGAGEVTVSAYQEGTSNYLAADPVSQVITVAKAAQQILFQTFEDVLITHDPIPLNSTSSSGLPLAYSVNGPASMANDSIFLTGESGVVWVLASQAGNVDYNPVTDSTSFAVNDPGKSDQTISFDSIADYTYGVPWIVVSATATSTLKVEFTVESGPATVSQDTVYLSGAGTVVVRALQSGNASYNPAPVVSRTFTVHKAGQSINFTPIPDFTYGDDPYPLEATASSGLAVTFAVNSGKAQVVNDSLVLTGAGSVMVSAYQAGNSNYLEADPVPQTVTVAKADQQIVFQAFPDVLISNPAIALTGTATSGLSLAYTIKGPATLVSNTIELTSAPGTVWVIANQAGNDDYNAVIDSTSFNVTDPGKDDQTIDFNSIADQTYDKEYVVVKATATSGLKVSFSIVSGPATVSEDTVVNFTGVGTVQVKADQAGNGTYNPAPSVTNSFEITKGIQTISFTDIPDMTYGDDPWPLEATATSGLTVTFEVNSGKAQIVSNELQLTGAGVVMVSANQAGNSNYLPADPVSQSVTVGKASQQITWQNLPNVEISNPDILLTTSSTSGLSLTFSVTGPASIVSNTLKLNGTSGTVTVFASHAGNDDYLPVSDNRSFMVTDPGKQSQTITFAEIDNVQLGEGSLVLTATASSGLAVTYQLVSGPGTLAGSTITFTGLGTITVTARQAGDGTYNPAPDVTRSFDVIEDIPCPNPVSFEDLTICEGDTVRISSGTSETGHTYSWTKQGIITILSDSVYFEVVPVVTTDYVYLEVLDSTECSVTDTFRVTVNPAPEFTYQVTTNPIVPGNNTQITLSGANSYTFDPSGSVTPLSAAIFNLDPEENTSYIVTGLSTEGCGTEQKIDIFVYCEQCSEKYLFNSNGYFNHGCDNRSYRNGANCTWTITPSGQITGISIQFVADSFDVKAGDFVRVYDGENESGTLMGTYDNNNRPPAVINVPGTAAFIHFVSNSTEVGRGFKAYYWIGTGVDDAGGSYISIYPNPNTGIFTLEMKQAVFTKAEAEIYGALGQKIWNRNIEPLNGSVNETIDLTGRPHGLYYLRIITREEVFYKTIIIE